MWSVVGVNTMLMYTKRLQLTRRKRTVTTLVFRLTMLQKVWLYVIHDTNTWSCSWRHRLCGRPPQYAPAPCKLTFDLLTLKVMSKSRVTWATSVPTLVFLGLSVLDLGPMYTTDRQNVRQTSDMHHRLMPLPYWLQEHNKWFDVAQLLHSTVCQHFFTGYTVPKECLHKIGIISPILSLGYFICKREKNLAHRASTIGSRRCGQPLNMLLP